MLKSILIKSKFFVAPLILVAGCLLFAFATPGRKQAAAETERTLVASAVKMDTSMNATVSTITKFSALYDSLNLDSLHLSLQAFTYAIQGQQELLNKGELKNSDIITIVDFSLPSSQKRLFVIDLSTGKLLFNTYVSHGRNSGTDMATRFSNDLNSFQSSLGFFVTGSTYKGEHGYSLRLDGKEKGINDRAYARSIVMHAADYVNEGMIKIKGYIGRSLGCPAVPPTMHKAIINAIKDGSCLFLYSPDKNYMSHSKIIGQPVLG